ncbi:LptA/OstA family protein [Deinococcus yavapaiensis]|uniref:OstA-like protein n=1 Tax=Deinococcus yavapaiensis KR-236 TaxID=694435 RepID=A0A318S9W0_9DEIO|nr:LptA/OstA family protein [Deinococcus yavapaiensis]PYE55930.1 OstA-like protein [Deinococcus yavapaiensis KR-236]
MKTRRTSLLLALCLGLALAQTDAPTTPDAEPASDEISITLERRTEGGDVRRIKIENTGRDEQTAALACTPQDGDPPTTPTQVVYYTPASTGVVVTVDENVIVGSLAVITQQPDGQGGTKSDGHVEMSAGSAKVLDEPPANAEAFLERCGVLVTPEVKADAVQVTQGKTKLGGSKLVYDESDGIARVEGPIAFERDTLRGKSDRIEVDVEKETTTLVGNVELRDGNRVSKAARVEYDDAKSVAVLRGTIDAPAESSTPKETIRAQTIRYNLDTEEIVVQGRISGKFDDEGETQTPPEQPGDAAPDQP